MAWLRNIPLTSPKLTLVTLLLTGCVFGYLKPDYLLQGQRREKLSDAANRYANCLRFGALELASPFVEPDQRPQFSRVFAGTGTERNPLRFTDVEVADIQFGTELGKATVMMQARVYRLPSVTEVELTEMQRWRYDPVAARWYVSPDFALYGDARTSNSAAPPLARPSDRPRSR